MTFERDLIESQIPKLQIVATRGILPGAVLQGGGVPNYTLGETKMPIKMGSQRVADIRIAFAGFYILSGASGETANPVDMIVEGAIEKVSPSYAVQGSTIAGFNITVKSGISHALTDPIGINTAANETVYLQMSTYVNSTETWPASQLSGTNSIQYVSTLAASSSQVGTAGAWSGTSRTSNYTAGPVAILGVPEKPFPSVAVIGDSIADGSGEGGAGDNNGNYGWICRGFWNVGADNVAIPYTRLTMAGDAGSNFLNGKSKGREALLQYCSHVVNHLGSNDVVGANLEINKTRMTAVWTAAKSRGKKVYQGLIMPRTTGTYTSPGGQTPVAGFEPGGVRDQLNAWIITQVGQGLLDGYIDPNPFVEDQNNRGRWKSENGALTSDGVHPNTAGHIAGSQASKAWAGKNALQF